MAIRSRKLANGSVVYDVEVRVEKRSAAGRRKQITRTVGTKQEAIRQEARLKVEAELGAVPDARMTVVDLLDSWVAIHSVGDSAWSATTRYGYARIIERDLKPAFGQKRLIKLTSRDLDDLYLKMRQRGVSSGTVHNAHAVIKAALNQAKKWKLVLSNVAEDATPGRVYRHEGAVATDAEVDQLMAAIVRIESGAYGARPCVVDTCDRPFYGRGFCSLHWKQWRYESRYQELALPVRRGGVPRGLRTGEIGKIKLALLIGAETGIRRGELAGLDWADFDWRNNEMVVQRSITDVGGAARTQPTKTRAIRRIPLAPDTVAALKHRRGIGPVVGMTPRQLSAWFDFLCDEAGIEPLLDARDGRTRRQKKIGWHALRHRLLTELGGLTDIKTVADIAGHSTTRVTERYMHSKQERAVAAIEAFADRRRQRLSAGVPD